MNPHRFPSRPLLGLWPPCRRVAGFTLALLVLGPPNGLLHAQAQDRAKAENLPRGEEVFPKDDDILTQGPIHEAFASVTQLQPTEGIRVNRQPPEPVNELPPGQRPEGDIVTWIPGYWMWDDSDEDFIWVSGVWRNLPPGRQWIPGYWYQLDDGWQWVSGYWAVSAHTEVTYLAPPPAPLEKGPNSPAPSRRHSWQPGVWEWHETDWQWRAGYWLEQREDYLWVPAYYVWTPRGCVFVPGYWDYVIPLRGVLFCPVRFVRYPRWDDSYWRPRVVVNIDIIFRDRFIRPRDSHYYIGDYYGDGYRDRGFIAPYAFTAEAGGWDPIFYRQRWEHRDDDNWTREFIEGYRYRESTPEARPPRNWQEARGWRGQGPRGEERFVIAEPLDDLARRGGPEPEARFRRVIEAERERYMRMRDEFSNFRQERRRLEEVAGRREPEEPLEERREASRMRSAPKDSRETEDRRDAERGRGTVERGTLPESPAASRANDEKSGPPPERTERPPTRSEAPARRDDRPTGQPSSPERQRPSPESPRAPESPRRQNRPEQGQAQGRPEPGKTQTQPPASQRRSQEPAPESPRTQPNRSSEPRKESQTAPSKPEASSTPAQRRDRQTARRETAPERSPSRPKPPRELRPAQGERSSKQPKQPKESASPKAPGAAGNQAHPGQP